ncbi:MAG: hypothetical protein IKD94_06750, partial [Erysipelotrichaceae bacterium]|nr:hypothetical protein [Erysipelotrichaceae bacterium]
SYHSWTVDDISFRERVVSCASSQESLRKDLPQWEDVLFDLACDAMGLPERISQPPSSSTDSLLKGH